MLKSLRLKLGLTQGEMVAKMNEAGLKVTVPMLSLLESKQVNPSDEMADWIARQVINSFDEPLSGVADSLLEHLKNTDVEHPLTRNGLKAITGLDDRQNRRLIGELRDRGEWIIDNNEGYYITKDENELMSWMKKFSSYAYTILNRKRAMLANVQGQVRM